MTNEITIYPSANGGGLSGPEDDFSGPASQSTGNSGKVLSPLQRVHRLLRGRYWLAATLAIIGAVFGAVAGWSSRRPAYTVTGLIQIEPTTQSLTDQTNVVAMYQYYAMSQVSLITSAGIVDTAMHSDTWLNLCKTRHVAANDPAVFEARLDAGQVKNTFNIKVTFTDPDPKVSVAAVHAVVEAYVNRYGGLDAKQRQQKMTILNDRVQALKSDILSKQHMLDEIIKGPGSEELSPLIEASRAKLQRMEEDYRNLRDNLNLLETRTLTNKELQSKDFETFMVQLSYADPIMKGLLDARSKAKTELDRLLQSEGLLPGHNRVRTAQYDLEAAQKASLEYAKEATHRSLNVPQLTPDTVNVVSLSCTPEDIANWKKQATQKQLEVEKVRGELRDLNTTQVQIKQIKDDIARATAEIHEYERKLSDLDAVNSLTKRVNVLDPGTEPTAPTEDKRKQFALLGMAVGGMFPIGALLLIGLLDRRYRYSDDTDTDIGGLPLLGVLPNLPDRLSDPHQAAIASHCVHQIRTRLQINSPGGTRHVWAVTSAASGDGKSSLVLSLGLSYAACGARTLLIDCDLVGAGLSHRLNIKTPSGILDAIASRTLLQYVHSTDAADVAILPAGAAQGHQASLLSPAALRRLIFEAKKHFEIIIIDTGPILGSIEASLVCAEADGVLLCVSRSQKRPAVIKALVQLKSVGARIAGIVFNRANAWDFEQHMSGQSQRVQSRNGNGASGSPFGPMARAVASSSFKSEPSNEG